MVRWFPARRRRSWRGWAVVIALIAANELRGGVVVAQLLGPVIRACRH